MSRTPLPVLPMPAPEPAPRPQDATVLLPVITHMVQTVPDAQARKQFDALADMARHPALPLPVIRPDGRADHGTRNAVIYAAVVQAIRLFRSGASAKAIKDIQTFIHDATFLPHIWIVGSQEQGFTIQFVEPKEVYPPKSRVLDDGK